MYTSFIGMDIFWAFFDMRKLDSYDGPVVVCLNILTTQQISDRKCLKVELYRQLEEVPIGIQFSVEGSVFNF